MTAILIDTETTDATEDAEPIEVAWQPIEFTPSETRALMLGEMRVQRYKPTRPITFGAMATHHILPIDLERCPPSSEFSLDAGAEYLIGHNIDFDWRVIGKPDVKRICTLALARAAWPTLDSHRLGAIMYSLYGEEARAVLRSSHSAKADVCALASVVMALVSHLELDSMEALCERSELARIPTVMSFGKHKGTRIDELPVSYRRWILDQADFDPYIKIAVERSFKR